MITGFNTDIKYDGVTYHVQTEDKGVSTPLILSLVYQGGTILASKRSSYTDLLEGSFDEKILTERLQKQHKLICAAVRGGRIEDLKRMTMEKSADKQAGLIAQRQVRKSKVEAAEKSEPVKKSVLNDGVQLLELPVLPNRKPIDLSETLAERSGANVTSKFVRSDEGSNVSVSAPPDELIVEGVEIIEIIEEEIILPADAVVIINDAAKNGQTGDDKLKIQLLNEDFYKGGDQKTLNILVRRGNREEGLSNARIMVKVLGSSFRPLIFHSKTDDQGFAAIDLQLPYFKGGRAAILIRAMVDGEEVETRRVVRQSS